MPPEAITLIQLSDSHVRAVPGSRQRGRDCHETLAAVVAQVRSRESADAVLATGDLSDDGSAAAYHRLRALYRRLGVPVYALTGNHDDPAILAATLPGDGIHVTPTVRLGNWLVVMLDSTLAGREDGRLGETELKVLDAALLGHPDLHGLICLHHHPVAVGGGWRDHVALEDAEALFAVLDRRPTARAVVWGHIHQAFDGARNGVRFLGSPATCFQFQAGPAGLATSDDPPGYRRLRLFADGTMETEVVFVYPEGGGRMPAIPKGKPASAP